jgi:hypothetical protein
MITLKELRTYAVLKGKEILSIENFIGIESRPNVVYWWKRYANDHEEGILSPDEIYSRTTGRFSRSYSRFCAIEARILAELSKEEL